MCDAGHRKHPLQRYDRGAASIECGPGFHGVGCAEALYEPAQPVFLHHFPFREEGSTRRRLALLWAAGERSADAGRRRWGDVAHARPLSFPRRGLRPALVRRSRTFWLSIRFPRCSQPGPNRSGLSWLRGMHSSPRPTWACSGGTARVRTPHVRSRPLRSLPRQRRPRRTGPGSWAARRAELMAAGRTVSEVLLA